MKHSSIWLLVLNEALLRTHFASIVLDAEAVVWQAVVRQELGVLALAAFEVLVLCTDGVEFVQEGLIGHGARPQALLVQHGQDPVLVLQEDKGRRGGGLRRG